LSGDSEGTAAPLTGVPAAVTLSQETRSLLAGDAIAGQARLLIIVQAILLSNSSGTRAARSALTRMCARLLRGAHCRSAGCLGSAFPSCCWTGGQCAPAGSGRV